MKLKITWKLPAALFVIILMFVFSPLAQGYKIGPGDVLEIKFWQNRQFNTVATVAADGNITVESVGQIRAEGLTTQELEAEIVKRISRLIKEISQATVVVKEYNYQYVFVTGQVKNPGKLTFEEIPDLWTIINEAGGITEFGDLTRVTIIRGGKDAGEIEHVNVSARISAGQVDKLPKIEREDTIEISRLPGGLSAPGVVVNAEKRNFVYVLGAVAQPGQVSYESNMDLIDALAKVGGPTERADLKKVMIVSKDGYYGQSLKVNLQKYIDEGSVSRYNLKQEDALIIPSKKGGLFGSIGLSTVVTVVGLASSILLLNDQINN